MMDPKPRPRIKDTALLEVLKWECVECEVTGETQDLHLHHVIYKSHGGDDLRQNIICLVEWLHTLYHAADPRAQWLLAEHVNTKRSDVAAYISEKLGSPEALLEWFARHERSTAWTT